MLLSFSHGNAKLPTSTMIFSLPAGHTCPGAHLCLSRAHRDTGKIIDGIHTQFRCYAASEETRPSVRQARWRNLDLLRQPEQGSLNELILLSVRAHRRAYTERVRWFGSGDFFSAALRDAIIHCAERTPDLLHYAYTKNLPLFLVDHRRLNLPDNLRITASHGGRYDHLIGLFDRTARVVHTEDDAQRLGLAIDFNDSHAWQVQPTHFAHLTHGSQPAGSEASKALAERRKRGAWSGYSAKQSGLHAA